MFWVPGIRLCDGIAAEYASDNKLIRFSHDFEEDILAASRNLSLIHISSHVSYLWHGGAPSPG